MYNFQFSKKHKKRIKEIVILILSRENNSPGKEVRFFPGKNLEKKRRKEEREKEREKRSCVCALQLLVVGIDPPSRIPISAKLLLRLFGIAVGPLPSPIADPIDLWPEEARNMGQAFRKLFDAFFGNTEMRVLSRPPPLHSSPALISALVVAIDWLLYRFVCLRVGKSGGFVTFFSTVDVVRKHGNCRISLFFASRLYLPWAWLERDYAFSGDDNFL